MVFDFGGARNIESTFVGAMSAIAFSKSRQERNGVMNDWKMRGVWVVVGATLGIGGYASFTSQPLGATATSGGVEGTLIATGRSANEAVEQVWLLDDRGMLSCHMMTQQNRVITATPVDVKQYLKGKGGKKGKYAMVTGRFAAQSQVSDLLYVTESSSNAIAVFNLTNEGIHFVNTLNAPRN